MDSNKLLTVTVTLLSAMLIPGCHAEASDAKGNPSAGIPGIDRPKKGAPSPAPVIPNPAPPTVPDGDKEIVDMSLG